MKKKKTINQTIEMYTHLLKEDGRCLTSKSDEPLEDDEECFLWDRERVSLWLWCFFLECLEIA